MADSLFLSRDTRVFIRLDNSSDSAWEIPVLDGFSFSQATNATEVSLNEMAASDGTSRRDRQLFNDSYAPAEWSFSTYARPFFDNSKDRSVEQVLWGLLAGDAYYNSATNEFRSASATGTAYIKQSTNQQTIDFAQSNKTTLGTASIWFLMGDTSDSLAAGDTGLTAYKIEGCCVNEVTFDFDIDGIATLNWSGMGKIIKEVSVSASSTIVGQSATADDDIWVNTGSSSAYSVSAINIAKTADFATTVQPTVDGIDTDTNYIRNRLSYLSASSLNTGGTATVALTGGNITISNNITFVTPETLGVVNQPLGHVTGTRTIGGNVTCYLNNEADSSADLFSTLIGATDTITNVFNLTFSIGGTIATDNVPAIEFKMESCHLEIPTHSIEDVISLETNFHALPSTVGGTNELVVSYSG